MNKFLWFVFGLLTGASAGYLVSKTQFDKRLDKELEMTERHYERKIMEIGRIEADTPSLDIPKETEECVFLEKAEKIIDRYRTHTINVIEDTDRDIHFAERESPTEEDPVHMITSTDFFQDKAEYEKLSLHYYTEDEVFTDDQEEPIDDIMLTLGIDEWPDANEDVIYIRNNKMETDFEISKVLASYGEEVLGLGKEDLL